MSSLPPLQIKENKLESELFQEMDSDKYPDYPQSLIRKPGLIAERGSNEILQRSLAIWKLREPVRF